VIAGTQGSYKVESKRQVYQKNRPDSLPFYEPLDGCRSHLLIVGSVDSGLTMYCRRNPKPLIQVEPKMLIDQKNKKAFATGGDILLANGEKIPLPGGFALPTTGLWSNLLDIPVVS